MDSKFLSGSLEMLVLQIAQDGDTYGYEITQQVMKRSGGYFELKEGSLYPALHRMERRGLLESFWEDRDTGRRRKFYRITVEGRAALENHRAAWGEFVAGVNGVLGLAVRGVG
jgi:PadR family transcriptional regulator, regulatory protein PadR